MTRLAGASGAPVGGWPSNLRQESPTSGVISPRTRSTVGRDSVSTPDDDRTPPEQFPDSLVDSLGSLEPPGHRSVRATVDRRLDSVRTPIADQILNNTDGKVVDVEDHELYALARKRPTGQEDSKADSRTISLCRVRPEELPDGEETLHWAFPEDVLEPSDVECENGGATRTSVSRAVPLRRTRLPRRRW